MTWEGMVGRGKTESTGSVCVGSWSHGDLVTSSYFLGSLIIGILLIFFSKNRFILDLQYSRDSRRHKTLGDLP